MKIKKILFPSGIVLLVFGHFLREYGQTIELITTGKIIILSSIAILSIAAYINKFMPIPFLIAMLLISIFFFVYSSF